MKNILHSCLLLIGTIILLNTKSRADYLIRKDSLYTVFDGRTPCQELIAMMGENPEPECTKVKWRLKLYKDPSTNQPGTYHLDGYHFKKDKALVGKWHISKGTPADAEAIILVLDRPGKPSIYLLCGEEQVLFFLDQNQKLMVGNRDFGYTLNRINPALLHLPLIIP